MSGVTHSGALPQDVCQASGDARPQDVCQAGADRSAERPQKPCHHGPVTFRKARLEDAARITDIHNQAVVNRCCCDTETCTVEERTPWIKAHMNAGDRYPLYVGEADGEIFGYGYLTEYRFGRPAVAGTAEVSYFLDFAWHGQGLGQAFLEFLMEEARGIGFENLVAILMASNARSVGLLRKLGFELWGSMPDAVKIGDLVTDHVYYGLKI